MTNNSENGTLYFLGGTLVFIVLLSLFVTFVQPTLDLPMVRNGKFPDFRFEGVRLTHFDDGKILWEINANQADVNNDDKVVVLKQSTGNIYSGHDQSNSIGFHAVKVNYFLEKRIMRFERATTNFVIGDKAYSLFALSLDWDAEYSRFSGKRGIVLKSNSIEVAGDSFLADLPIRQMKIVSNVKAELKVTE